MSIFRQMEQRHLVASCPRLKMAVMITSSASGSRVYSWTLLAILALANQMSLAAEADIETSPTTDTFPNCRTQERTEFMRCRMRFEATGLSNRAEMRKNYCSIITNIIQVCTIFSMHASVKDGVRDSATTWNTHFSDLLYKLWQLRVSCRNSNCQRSIPHQGVPVSLPLRGLVPNSAGLLSHIGELLM